MQKKLSYQTLNIQLIEPTLIWSGEGAVSASLAVWVPVGDEAPLAEPGLSVTLWAFSPHFHG